MNPTTGLVLPSQKTQVKTPVGLPISSTPMMGGPQTPSRGVVINPTRQEPVSMELSPIPNVNSIYSDYMDKFKDEQATRNLLQTSYNDYGDFSKSASNISNLYNNIYNETDPYYNNFLKINKGMDSDINKKLQDQLKIAYGQYGPEGEQTRRVSEYYAEVANNIAAQNAANLGRLGVASNSIGAGSASNQGVVTKAQLDANTNYINMKQKEVENYDGIYKNLNSYIDNFIKTYGNSKDKYIRDTYNQLIQYKTGIEQSRANSLIALEGSRLEKNIRDSERAKRAGTKGIPTTTYTPIGTDATTGMTQVLGSDGKMYAQDKDGQLYNYK